MVHPEVLFVTICVPKVMSAYIASLPAYCTTSRNSPLLPDLVETEKGIVWLMIYKALSFC
jgi:hypothetical protein